ncbi:MAG: hypothetical protein ACK4GN_15650 [Runella sp.]
MIIYIILGLTPFSDINGFFNQARAAYQLKLVYRDFGCMYSPFFPYLNALALAFWFDKKAIVLLMILIEGVALWATFRFYRKSLSESELLYRGIAYLLMPGALVFCVLGGQEDVWLWLAVLLAYFIWQRFGRVEWFGQGLAVGFMFTKAVFILMGPAFLLLVPQPRRWVLAAILVGIPCVAVLHYYTEWAWIEQPLHEAATLRAPNLMSVISPLTFNLLGAGHKVWNWAGLLLTTVLGSWLAYRLRYLPFTTAFSAVFVVLYATMMLLQQSAYANYLFIFLMPIVFRWINFSNFKEIFWLLVYNFLSVVHPSLWWRLERPYYLSLQDIAAKPIFIVDYLMQCGIVVCTFYCIKLVIFKSLELTKQQKF